MAIDRRHYTFLFVIFMVMVFAVPGFATPRLKIEPPAKQIAPGKSVVLKIQLEWPREEGSYEFNSLEPKLENLTLVDQRQSQEIGATVSQTFLYEFRPIQIGPAVIHPFEISYRQGDMEPWIPMLVPEHQIKVVSNLPIRVALIGSGIVAGLLIALFVGLKQWERWKLWVAAKRVPPVDPKQQIYKQAEEAIMNFTSPYPKEKITHWADQFRTVVETYYDVSSVASPTDILSFLKVKGIPAGERNEISRIFGELTEMQFARHDISDYDLDKLERSLLQYVTSKIIMGAL
ncbi:MAG: hypothetical protein ABH891_01540 [Candidatus Omnitrophota bacterium]